MLETTVTMLGTTVTMLETTVTMLETTVTMLGTTVQYLELLCNTWSTTGSQFQFRWGTVKYYTNAGVSKFGYKNKDKTLHLPIRRNPTEVCCQQSYKNCTHTNDLAVRWPQVKVVKHYVHAAHLLGLLKHQSLATVSSSCYFPVSQFVATASSFSSESSNQH